MRANESQLLRTRSRIAQIREADTAYYKFDRPILSNREYDLLTERRCNGIRESKSDRFRRAAKARVNKIIKTVRLLGDCSNPAAYSYTAAQVQQIFTTLQDELSKARKRYAQARKRRFSLPKEQDDGLPEYPTIVQSLPDGTRLRAVAYNGESYPGINIYWDTNSPEIDGPICFVEYNPERSQDHKVCIGAYRSDQDDTIYYKPYMAERKSDEEY